MTTPSEPPNPRQNVTHGLVNGVFQPQWTISEDTRGLLEGTVAIRYTMNPSSPGTPPLPGRGSPHPWDLRLKCYKTSAQMGNNGQAIVTSDYIGLRLDPTLAEVETSGSTTSQPLPLHPNFPSMAMATKPTASNPNFVYMPFVDTVNNNRKDFERFNVNTAPEGLRGADSYSAPRATVRISFYTANQGTVSRYLSNVGTYADTPLNANGPLPAGGNFLLNSVNVSTYGTVYKLSCEWIMSEQGSTWSEKIYRKFGDGGKKAKIVLPYVGYEGSFKGATSYDF